MLKLDQCGISGFCWEIWPSLIWNFSDSVFYLHYGPQSPSMPFILLGVVEVFKKFEISIFWKKYYNIKFFKKFFLQNHFLNQNILFRCHINIFWEEKKWKILYVIIFFQKIVISNFLKTFTTPRGMNGINGPRGP